MTSRDAQISALQELKETPGWDVLRQALLEKITASNRRLASTKWETADEAARLLAEEQAKQGVWRRLLTELELYGLPEGK
jgi:hypothetical protein